MVDLGWGIPWRALVQWVVNAAKLWLKMEYLGGLPPWLHPLNWSVYMTTIPVERDTLMHCPTLQFPQRIIHLNINISDVFVEQTTTCDIGEIAKLKSQLPKAIYFSESETIFFYEYHDPIQTYYMSRMLQKYHVNKKCELCFFTGEVRSRKTSSHSYWQNFAEI